MPAWTNDLDAPDRHLIVISAPRQRHPKYWRHFEAIIDFDIRLAQTIIGHDNVIVLASKAEMPFLRGKLPDDVLLEANLKDIWIRDFAPVLTTKMVQFVYRPSYLKPWEAAEASDSFAGFCRRYGLKFERSKLVLDGGNLVSNHKDMAVVTERVLQDNNGWTKDEIIAELKDKLALDHVAMIPGDPGDITGHADGMVAWVTERALAVTGYPEPLKSRLVKAVRDQLPRIAVVPLPALLPICASQRVQRFESAFGLSANAITTSASLYVPSYGMAVDGQFEQAAIAHDALPRRWIDADRVSWLGGSVRCLTWSLVGLPAVLLCRATAHAQ